jgi:hypothetical protein
MSSAEEVLRCRLFEEVFTAFSRRAEMAYDPREI